MPIPYHPSHERQPNARVTMFVHSKRVLPEIFSRDEAFHATASSFGILLLSLLRTWRLKSSAPTTSSTSATSSTTPSPASSTTAATTTTTTAICYLLLNLVLLRLRCIVHKECVEGKGVRENEVADCRAADVDGFERHWLLSLYRHFDCP